LSPRQHVIASGAVSLVFFTVSKSWAGAAVCFLSGVLIDIDHFFDLWIARRRVSLSYSELHRFCSYEKDGRLHLVFHSYELHALLWLSVLALGLSWPWVGLAVGTSTHLLIDQLCNPIRPFTYFFLYRLKCRFAKECAFTDNYYRTLS